MNRWTFVAVFGCFSIQAIEEKVLFEQCLVDCYGVDEISSAMIAKKVSPLIENEEYHPVIHSFIQESEQLKRQFLSPTFTPNGSSDTFETSPYHAVLFENANVRISWAVTKSGEQEPPQRHLWKTLMLIVHSAQFHSETESGIAYEDNWSIGVYLLDPSPELLLCKNIGFEEFNGLLVEIKSHSSKR